MSADLESRMLVVEAMQNRTVVALEMHVKQCERRAIIATKILYYVATVITGAMGWFIKIHFGF